MKKLLIKILNAKLWFHLIIDLIIFSTSLVISFLFILSPEHLYSRLFTYKVFLFIFFIQLLILLFSIIYKLRKKERKSALSRFAYLLFLLIFIYYIYNIVLLLTLG